METVHLFCLTSMTFGIWCKWILHFSFNLDIAQLFVVFTPFGMFSSIIIGTFQWSNLGTGIWQESSFFFRNSPFQLHGSQFFEMICHRLSSYPYSFAAVNDFQGSLRMQTKGLLQKFLKLSCSIFLWVRWAKTDPKICADASLGPSVWADNGRAAGSAVGERCRLGWLPDDD